MDKYENIEVVGEGSYGVVMKCRHRETGQVVAIKKFLETEEDVQVRKLALREIRILKKLRHDNLINMIEVFRRRKRFYLVFEFLDHTVLDELERTGDGLGAEISKRYVFQVLRGLNFCHNNHIMHRDVKPENVLVSSNGVIKLCDFGFARLVGSSKESCTDYVATRWYRAPELLVGDSRYGREIDVWAVGCLYAEMMTGDPIFPGDSDIDQLYRITKVLGSLCGKYQSSSVGSNSYSKQSLRLTAADEIMIFQGPLSLRNLFPSWSSVSLDFLSQCLRLDPDTRPKCSVLLHHLLFLQDNFSVKFLEELQECIAKESNLNPLLNKKIQDRKASILSVKPSPRVCRSSTGRWQMTILHDTKELRNKIEFDSTIKCEEVQRTERPLASQINRPREVCYFGPVSVIPNTTYIRRLELKGLQIANSKGCTLPVLTPKDSMEAKTSGKRKRLDLPSVDH
ncbi:cyclin-dependent kinase-like 1 [Polistes fuscatus]|uniref:cyclin-dependent kinase-like 1 n=1 Tax=Polistes fuscatus TaxID=30207 RepID=UPI001CA9C37E|nr:cyclin-dependent kinase-like 1 [Polistes fuscatus]XP_043499980.1 cyclin-dependent kinase-like 1 [Polistes fuscatus]XP_043500049.1 cyclin-dependent kinase-like 1 [Polistes fuscatus]XP_043500134.1 cyclin-dependent kinase-like 1 [Polistes fuscatus]XP_043500217.1 cyclin-dependent kinase-like 1 [Polistes fuscatus]XP_043500306.1 cyclin-dependent kinase-like 1 [Polistes fuscatus]XP_043500387.1 cyclin-dependent kinase-like 1 [Polistes fuscatus]